MRAHLRHALPFFAVCLGATSAIAAPESALPPAILAQAKSGPPKTITFSQNEVQAKTVATDATGLLQVLFGDGTTLTLGPNSEITIDRFAFQPGSGEAKLSATLKRGVFRFIGGRTSKTPGGVALTTPFGTVGIDSAGVELDLGGNSSAHFDMLYGRAITLTRGSSVLARVHTPGYSIVPAAGGGSASVRKTPADWRGSLRDQLSLWAPTLLPIEAGLGPGKRPS